MWVWSEWEHYNCTLMRVRLWQGSVKTTNGSGSMYCVCLCVPTWSCISSWVWFSFLPLLLSYYWHLHKHTHLPIHPFTYSPTSWRHLSSTWMLTSSPFGSECWLGQVVNKNHSRGPGVPHTLRCLLSVSPQPSALPAVNSWKRLIHNCSSSSRVSKVCPHD